MPWAISDSLWRGDGWLRRSPVARALCYPLSAPGNYGDCGARMGPRGGGWGRVLSHFSAGQLWGLCGSHGPVEVLRRSGGATHKGIKLHQTRRLEPYEVTIERAIPAVSVERVLLDLAGRTDRRRLERIFVQAYKSDRLSWSRLRRVLGRRRGCRGVASLRQISEEVSPGALETRSVSEIDFLAL